MGTGVIEGSESTSSYNTAKGKKVGDIRSDEGYQAWHPDKIEGNATSTFKGNGSAGGKGVGWVNEREKKKQGK